MNTQKLRRAIKAGDVNQIREILTVVPVDVRLYRDWTPLHTAVKSGNKDVVAAILELGAPIDATTEMHQTPLDIALQLQHKKIVQFLRNKGARCGAEISLHHAVAAGNLKAVKKHLAAGADINQLRDGELPLGIALGYRHWDIAKFLLNRKCEVTKTQAGKKTPLHIAAACGAPAFLLSKMLKLGAQIDSDDDCSYTPLFHAAESGYREIVDWLLDHGADVTRGHVNGSTPVYCALRGGDEELASHLIDRGGKSTLHQAVQANNLARARQKLNAGADANNEKDEHFLNTPLETAIWRDSPDMAMLLLEYGADPNLPGHNGDTPLHEAVHAGSAKMVKLLLAHGANPDIPNAQGDTPIELARLRNRIHLANMMEADLDKKLSLEATQKGIDQLYTVKKVAELLSVDDTFILELIKAKRITGLHLDDKTLRIPAGSVQRYLAKLAK